MGAIASQITSLTLVTQPFIQTQIKENIKAPRHWPGEFPTQMASNKENVSIWWRHHDSVPGAGRKRSIKNYHDKIPYENDIYSISLLNGTHKR